MPPTPCLPHGLWHYANLWNSECQQLVFIKRDQDVGGGRPQRTEQEPCTLETTDSPLTSGCIAGTPSLGTSPQHASWSPPSIYYKNVEQEELTVTRKQLRPTAGRGPTLLWTPTDRQKTNQKGCQKLPKTFFSFFFQTDQTKKRCLLVLFFKALKGFKPSLLLSSPSSKGVQHRLPPLVYTLTAASENEFLYEFASPHG